MGSYGRHSAPRQARIGDDRRFSRKKSLRSRTDGTASITFLRDRHGSPSEMTRARPAPNRYTKSSIPTGADGRNDWRSTRLFSLYADSAFCQSVGADCCTQEAITRLPPLRKPTTVMDLGCGSGCLTILLARRFRGPIAAIDPRPDLLDRLTAAAKADGLAVRISPRCEDPARLKDRPGAMT